MNNRNSFHFLLLSFYHLCVSASLISLSFSPLLSLSGLVSLADKRGRGSTPDKIFLLSFASATTIVFTLFYSLSLLPGPCLASCKRSMKEEREETSRR